MRFKPLIDAMLLTDLYAPRKQKHTATRIFHRLIQEHSMVDVSYPVLARYVSVRRPEIRVEAGRGPMEAFIPQTHRAGAEAEVDFGDVAIRLRGELQSIFLPDVVLREGGPSDLRLRRLGGLL